MAMMSKQSSRTMSSANGRRKRRFVVVIMMCVVVMAMVSLFATTRTTTVFLVAAMPLLEDSIGDSSATATTISEVETIVVDEATTTTSASVTKLSSASSSDCIDDSSFRYEDEEKNCKWVGGGSTKNKRKKNKKRKKRCKKDYRGEPLAARCRNTCDYNKCRTTKILLTVGVYYYPWWGSDFHRGKRPDLYLRSQLQKQEFPALGEYNDTEPDVIGQHLKWSRKNNIHLWVTSWWGEDRREDLTIKNNILNHPKLGSQKIAIFYETTGRIREKDDYNLDNVKPDLKYLCQQYFRNDNYYQKVVSVVDDNGDIQTRSNVPVFFVYLTRKLETLGLLNKTVALMREGASESGCNEIFIVGDQVFQGPPSITDNVTDLDLIPFELLDGVTNYDVYGSLRGGKNEGYVGSREKVTQYYQEEQRKWKNLAQSKGCAFIPGTSPGFNDLGVRPEKNRIPLSRRLNVNAAEGSLFQAALQEARTLVDPQLDYLLMVNSFNEWHEDTQIEPVVAVDGSKGLNSQTNLPTNLTYNLEYEAYGNLYLKILNEETKKWDISSLAASAASTVVSTSLTVAASTIQTEELWTISSDSSGSGSGSSIDQDITTISDMIGFELD